MPWYRRRKKLLRDLDREFAFHLAERVDELRATGLTEGEALEIARRQFGNLTLQKERSGDMHISIGLETTLRNIRLGARSLKKTPALSAAVILTLALGIGANSAVFSVIDAVLLRPLPFPNGDQLMRIIQKNPRSTDVAVAPVRVEDWNRMSSTFQAITGYYAEDVSETSGELPEKLRRAFVGPRFLEVWGVQPALGSLADRGADDRFLSSAKVFISDRLWRRRFGANPTAIGKRLHFGTSSPVIAGVMPPSFWFPDLDVDLWWPTVGTPARDATWFYVVGRLKLGASVEQAQADLSTVQAQLAAQYPATDTNLTPQVRPLKEETVGEVRQSLWLVFGSVSVLLLIACANIAALLLSRAIQRNQEIAIRLSLGASRLSVAAQLLTETAILAACGGAIGILLAAGAPKLFRVLAGNLPRMQEVRIDWRSAVYSLLCTFFITFLCGVLPAIRGTRLHTTRGEVSGRHRAQWLLVGVQITLAVTLLAGAGLLLRSLQALGHVAPGFSPDRVLTFHISGSYAETVDYPGLYRRMDRTLAFLDTIPGVQSSATAAALPGVPAAFLQWTLKLSGSNLDPEAKVPADVRFVSPSYFATMSIPLIEGEACPAQAQSGAATGNVLVNRSFKDRYLPGPLVPGRQIRGFANLPSAEIRGVVGDAREDGLNHQPSPAVYWCTSAPGPEPFFLVRTSVAPLALVETIRRKLREIEPTRSVFDFELLTDSLDDVSAENRLRTLLLSAFAATAVLLACVGLYSTLSYLVVVKRREIGLRVALGAERRSIVRHFFAQGLGVTGASCLAGLALALALTRFLAGMLYGVSPNDPATLFAVVLFVLTVGSCAALAPAIRAASVDPMKVLRDE